MSVKSEYPGQILSSYVGKKMKDFFLISNKEMDFVRVCLGWALSAQIKLFTTFANGVKGSVCLGTTLLFGRRWNIQTMGRFWGDKIYMIIDMSTLL